MFNFALYSGYRFRLSLSLSLSLSLPLSCGCRCRKGSPFPDSFPRAGGGVRGGGGGGGGGGVVQLLVFAFEPVKVCLICLWAHLDPINVVMLTTLVRKNVDDFVANKPSFGAKNHYFIDVVPKNIRILTTFKRKIHPMVL